MVGTIKKIKLNLNFLSISYSLHNAKYLKCVFVLWIVLFVIALDVWLLDHEVLGRGRLSRLLPNITFPILLFASPFRKCFPSSAADELVAVPSRIHLLLSVDILIAILPVSGDRPALFWNGLIKYT